MRRDYYRDTWYAIVYALATLFVARTLSAQANIDSTGSLVVLVSAKEAAQPLAYSVVSVGNPVRESFTNDAGVVVFQHLPPGRIQLRARHLGYTPAELTETVHGGRADTVRVALSRVAISLGIVHVRGLGRCLNPGPPKPSADPTFAEVFEQLRENADQYRLLATQYPFAYSVERISSIHYVGGDSVIQRVDTLVLGTGMHWHYAPGTLVVETDDPHNHQVVFNIPALIHFAEQSFLANHCFANGGADTLEGRSVIRVDFAAAAKIKSPDVDGTIYLDPRTYQIRRSVLRLTKIPDQTPQISAVEVVTDFREVLPSVPIIWSIRSTHALFADRARPILPDAAYERQQLLQFTWLNGRPGDARKP